VIDTNEVYDPVTNSWEYRAPMPFPAMILQSQFVRVRFMVT
jgi:hypothetical protein